MRFLFPVLLCLGLVSPAAASPRAVLSLSTQTAQGTWESGVQRLILGSTQSTLIDFSETGETVQKVWLDNPSQVVVDFDGCLSGGGFTPSTSGSCNGNGAKIVRLRQLNRAIGFPPFALTGTGSTTQLTVITSRGGDRTVYQFQLLLRRGAPPYSLVRLIPAPPLAPAQLVSVSQEYQQTVLRQLSQGFAYAEANQLLDQRNPEYNRLVQCIALMQQGTAFAEAMQRSGVSPKLIDRIRAFAMQR